MEIVDLRPRLERAADSGAPGSAPPPLPVRLASRLADGIASRRAARRLAPATRTLVVSVGNLRVGGTGKTPVTMALALALADRGLAGSIITRGHGAADAGPLVISPDDPRGGDEARLMARVVGGRSWTVVQSRRREKGLDMALAADPPPRVVILEDAFQTAAVGRHLDILILDAWTRRGDTILPQAGPVLPFGPYRESARGAHRAHIWLLETDDPGSGSSARQAVTGFSRRLALRSALSAAEAPPRAVYGLLSGLARPSGFEAGSAALLPEPPVLAVRCRDHSPYDGRLLERIQSIGEDHGVTAWVTTGKDWIKLANLWPAAVPVMVADLTVVWTGRKTLPDLVEERLEVLGANDPNG